MKLAKDIFLDALDLPAGDRTIFVEQQCHGDAQLRARVVSLLVAHDKADRVISEPTVHPWNLDAGTENKPEPPGTQIGPYTIVRLLGEGGFGAVYLATQEKPVKRQVALKLLRPGMDSRDILRRFDLERQALALMDHPGIAKVYDAGATVAGRPYIALEYVNGLPITDFCDKHRLGVRERLELFEDVCLAVQHAHGRGVIHRDLKPSNILVSMLDGKPFPTIIDFGIAKALHTNPFAQGALSLTLPQQIIGTPQYMPPEQATLGGGEVDLDVRADVYSLGAILYELLCGHPVFEREQLRNRRPSELEKLICEFEPPRPSLRVQTTRGNQQSEIAAARSTEPAKLARQLSGDLDWICMKALEKNRARRYPAAISFAEDLLRYLRDEPVEACPPTLSYRAAKFARRHRVEFAAGAAIAVALVAFTVGSAWFAVREYRAAADARAQLARANALAEFSQDILAGVDPAEARGMDSTLLRKILAGAMKRVKDKLADQPQAAASMMMAIGYARLQIGDLPEAESVLRQALEQLTAVKTPPSDTQYLEASENLAAVLVEANRLDEAETLLRTVLDNRRKALGETHARTIVTANNLGVLYEKNGRWLEAKTIFERIVAHREKTLGADHLDTLTSLNNLANALDELGEHQPAADMLERVLRGQRAALGEDHPRTILTTNNLAAVYGGLGRRDESLKLYESALEAKVRVQGPEHPSTLVGMINLASVYLHLKRFDEANVLYDRVLAVGNKTGAVRETRVAAYNGKALVQKNLGNLQDAVPFLHKAVEVAKVDLGENHPTLIILLANYASSLLDSGDAPAAEAAARQALALADSTVGTAHSTTLNPRRILARALAEQMRFAEAAELHERSLELFPNASEELRDGMKKDAANYRAAATTQSG